MRPSDDPNVTAAARSLGAPDATAPPASGVWTLTGGRLIIAEREGPATIVVPTEQVRLLAVDLPLPNRAKRLEALPFAVEDRIADPLESVHLALGGELAPRRFLVAVVRHAVMAEWIATAEAAGLGHAAMVPDALLLGMPDAGAWSVILDADRALVRSGDGTGFACPPALLLPAWHAAGRPQVIGHGAALPAEMAAARAPEPGPGLAEAALAASRLIDLRQNGYDRRSAGASPRLWRRLGWVVALGALAHAGIAAADTWMLRAIADRRAEDLRSVTAIAAPGASLPQDDLAGSVAALLPAGGAAHAPDSFLPLLSRISAALQPLSASLAVRRIGYEGTMLTLDIDPSDPALLGQVEAALRGAGISARAARLEGGAIRITAQTA